MKMRPLAGTLYVVPVDDIPSSKTEMGFSGKTDKQKPEVPYKFRVAAVGGPTPFHGLWVPAEVKVGDIISHTSTNATLREQRETAGFLIDDVWYLPLDFNDVMGVWEDEKEFNNYGTSGIAESPAPKFLSPGDGRPA